jgi:DNA-directed RNA polymerase subunit M/transcription elongation factor TFIIS
MDLLGNAIESIRLGVEDYQAGTHARLMSAVRNIHAGVLLLYKEALRRLSPADSAEVLVKAKIVPSRDVAGNVVFVGKGTKTADTQQIRERFEGLQISTDWKRFEAIASARNDVEHYYPRLNQQSLQVVVASAFAIIRQFVADELAAEPRELLGEPTWQAMLTVADVYEAEKKLCVEAIEDADWPSDAVKAGLAAITCSECGSDLLQPGEKSATWPCPVLICRSCGSSTEPDVFVASAVQQALSREMYLSHTDGDDVPYTQCPECGEDAYVVAEQQCALCGESADHTCAVCGNAILPEELILSPYCGWCAHQMGKAD